MAENPYQYLMDDEQEQEQGSTGSAWDNYQPWDVNMPTAPTPPTPTAPPTYSQGQQPDFGNGNIDPETGRPVFYPGVWGSSGSWGPMGGFGIPTMYEDSGGATNLRQALTNNLNRVSTSRGSGLAINPFGRPISSFDGESTGTYTSYLGGGGYAGVPATSTGTTAAQSAVPGFTQPTNPTTNTGTTGPITGEGDAGMDMSRYQVGLPQETGPAGPPTANPAPEGGWQVDDSGNYVSQPGWMEGVDFVSITDPSTGQVTQYPLPLRTEITPQNIEYWLQDDQTLKGLQTYFQSMIPYFQAQQNAYQWQNEFNEANRRYDWEQPWQQQLEGYNAALSGRQQYMNELLARDASNQWGMEFDRAAQNDAFAQQIATQELAMAEERMGRDA